MELNQYFVSPSAAVYLYVTDIFDRLCSISTDVSPLKNEYYAIWDKEGSSHSVNIVYAEEQRHNQSFSRKWMSVAIYGCCIFVTIIEPRLYNH